MSNAISDVKVRMYNVGFGDSFLLSYTFDEEIHRILVDCGYHLSGRGPRPIKKIVEQIIEDCRDEDGISRINIVVASHRHYDHIAGFSYKDLWSEVEVKEVWMPWTEDPNDPIGVRITDSFKKRANRLYNRLSQLMEKASLEKNEVLSSLREIVINALSNQEAIDVLRGGFSGDPQRKYYPKREGRKKFTTRSLPGAIVHLLGPSFDEDVIAELEPPPEEHYLYSDMYALDKEKLAAVANDGDPTGPTNYMLISEMASGNTYFQPKSAEDSVFTIATDATRLFVDLDEAGPAIKAGIGLEESDLLRKFDEWSYIQDDMLANKHEHLVLSIEQRNDIAEVLLNGYDASVVQLDDAVNNTSLMFVLELGKHILLFPGDSEYGTWKAAFENSRSRDLLEQITFLKVAHHGSYNATPKTLVEELLDNRCVAAVSTKEGTKDWPIPQKELLKAMRNKIDCVVRSDRKDKPDPDNVEREGDFWIDFTLE